VLAQWFNEARAEGHSEARAVDLIAARLGESPTEARRLIRDIGRVRFGGGGQRRDAKPAAVGNGARPAPQLDEDAMRAFYRVGRLTLAPEHALRALAKRFNLRVQDARLIVAETERELGSE
jgi:hypothetical protein